MYVLQHFRQCTQMLTSIWTRFVNLSNVCATALQTVYTNAEQHLNSICNSNRCMCYSTSDSVHRCWPASELDLWIYHTEHQTQPGVAALARRTTREASNELVQSLEQVSDLDYRLGFYFDRFNDLEFHYLTIIPNKLSELNTAALSATCCIVLQYYGWQMQETSMSQTPFTF